MTDEIVWEDPPEEILGRRRGASTEYVAFARALREHPKRWAVLPGGGRSEKGAQGTAGNIRRGRMASFTNGKYETAVDGTKIYVRYVGPEGDQEEKDEEARPSDSRPRRPDDGHTAKVRKWALDQGMEVPERGRLPKTVHEAYQRSQLSLVRGEE